MALRVFAAGGSDIVALEITSQQRAFCWYVGSSRQRRTNYQGMYNFTTTVAANCRLTATPSIVRSTASSIKIKKDVEDLWDSQADLVLKLRPVSFYNKILSPEDTVKKHYGFIAEEVAEIDLRLADLKFTEVVKDQWSDQGELIYKELDPPEPVGVDYLKIQVLLTNIVKRQKVKLENLETKIQEIEDSLFNIESKLGV